MYKKIISITVTLSMIMTTCITGLAADSCNIAPAMAAPVTSGSAIAAPVTSDAAITAPVTSDAAITAPVTSDAAITELPVLDVHLSHEFEGWLLRGTLPSTIKENATSILPYYSFDGKEFIYDQSAALDWTQDPAVIYPTFQPMASFLDGTIDHFWLRVQIESPLYNGLSQTVLVTRDDLNDSPVQELPQGTQIYTAIPSAFRIGRGFQIKYQYHVTIRCGDTMDELAAVLPATLPVEIQLVTEDNTTLAIQNVDYPIDWRLPDTAIQGDFVHSAATLTAPEHAVIVSSPTTSYRCEKLPPATIPCSASASIPTPINLVVTVVPAQERAVPLLAWESEFDTSWLSVSLQPKPTGAARILPEYSLNNGTTWCAVKHPQGDDLILLGHAVDAIPKYDSYTAPLYFDPAKAPMKEYLADNTKGFLVRLKIEGGAFDGISQAAKWPADYEYIPPPPVSDGNGGEGNRGDAGSGNDDGNNGQRPNLPPETLPSESEIPLAPKAETETLVNVQPNPNLPLSAATVTSSQPVPPDAGETNQLAAVSAKVPSNQRVDLLLTKNNRSPEPTEIPAQEKNQQEAYAPRASIGALLGAATTITASVALTAAIVFTPGIGTFLTGGYSLSNLMGTISTLLHKLAGWLRR